ncbi:hypothetical protein RJ640_009522 [Escallonia rubra]|uniref:D-isomer specific 2-hydroxyacid dehydrogenase catalytic domain-containing protein n=1 Tax=Escallonia rubra TaxID=112253 RepID=A0AA88RKR9_9ASTE|nr:hypothetical protein RJ640_009522 [Escallonia rubra]
MKVRRNEAGVDEVQFDKVPDVIGNYDICIVKSMRLCSSIISCAKRMKLIMQYGVGLEGVDVNAATENGVKVARISGANTGNAASCAEMAIYLMLGLLRKQVEVSITTAVPGIEVDEAEQTGAIFSLLGGGGSSEKNTIKCDWFPGNEMQIAVKQKKLGEPVGETLLGKKAFSDFPSSNSLYYSYCRSKTPSELGFQQKPAPAEKVPTPAHL